MLEDLVAGRSSLTEIAAALAGLRVTNPASGETQDVLIDQLTSSGRLSGEDSRQLRAALMPPRPAADGTMLRAPSLPGGRVAPGTSATDSGLRSGPPLSSWPGRGSVETAGPVVGVGTVLRDRFVIEEVLGQGGMGVVLKARDRRREEALDRNPYVAIKILGDDFKGHPDALVALQREARRMQQLSHPNIATVYDFDRDGEHVYLVMELLEGESLDHVIQRHSSTGLPKNEVARIVAGAGSALKHAHAKGIVHSDFKPANVFLTKSSEVKIIDFGIARIVKDATQLEEAMKTRFDAGKLGAWTNAYASPEQMMDGAAPDPRDDIYALGLVAYELLTGHHPFGSKSAVEARFNELKPAPIRALTSAQNKVLAAALNFNRAHRLGDAIELVQVLGGTASDATGTAGQRGSASGARADPASPARRRVQLSVTVVVLLIWLGLAGAYWWSRQSVETAHEETPATTGASSVPDNRPAAGAGKSPSAGAKRLEVRPAKTPVIADRTGARQGAVASVGEAAGEAASVAGGEGDAGPSPTDSWGRRAAVGAEAAAAAAEAAVAGSGSGGRPATGAGPDAAVSTEAPGAKKETLYRWVDKDNQVRFGAVPPPEYAKTAIKIVDTD